MTRPEPGDLSEVFARYELERVEPSALNRELAAVLYEVFVALTQRGFTESQSLAIVGYVVHSVTTTPQ